MPREESERRIFERIDIEKIEIRIGSQQLVEVEGINLSAQGILCGSNDTVKPESRINLAFRLPLEREEFEVQSEGVVVRSVPAEDAGYLVAIQFTEVGEPEQLAIETFLAAICN